MSEGQREKTLGRIPAAVKVPAALLLALVCLGVPHPPSGFRPVQVDVLAVRVAASRLSFRTAGGDETARVELTARDRELIRRELAAFTRRVARATAGRLTVRVRTAEVPGPLTRLAGPGPHWLSPETAAKAIGDRVVIRPSDTLLVFARVPEKTPVSHLGAAHGGDRGLQGACFAGILLKDGWLDGSGTVALHEWLHGLRWTLTEVAGFPDAAFPDPDDGRNGPDCCPDAPAGDGPFADHLLSRHLTPAMIRSLDPAQETEPRDGFVRAWTVDGRARAAASRTVLLAAGVRSARAKLPEGTEAIEIVSNLPLLVDGGEGAVRVDGTARLRPTRNRIEVRPAVGGAEVSFRVRVLGD